MTEDPATLYAALAARDARFDGVFFVGVTSTGIYCRPICPARTPRAANCRYFGSAAAAERAAFRPCLRCRPELAPGLAPVDGARRVASRIAQRIADGALDDGARLDELAAEFDLGARQLRRVVQQELGVSPIELVLTRRLLVAKQLLTETRLPVIQVAYASGFGSLRRFNDAFVGRYGMAPTRLRRTASAQPGVRDAAPPLDAGALTLQLTWRAPFDWAGVLAFLGARALAGVEVVGEDSYARTVRIGEVRGWLRVRNAPARRTVLVDASPSLVPVLPALLARVRALFDLGARPDMIAARLAEDPRLAPLVAARPGLRLPGGFDGFELAARAILGQQVTVKAATTLGARFAAAFGEPFATPVAGLARLTPTALRVAAATPAELGALGITAARARSLVALAQAVAHDGLRLEPGADVDATITRLCALPGIGPWTAQYIALRALRWPDAFPKEDSVLRRRLGGVAPAEAERLSQAWRPWRGYAALHLWRSGAPLTAP